MKKIILIAAMKALSAGATAQINFGAHVGGNLANIKGEQKESGTTTKGLTKPKLGFLVGVVAVIPVTDAISFRPEFNFIQKGYNLDVNRSQSGVKIVSTGDGTFNYIELPLNFVYRLPSGDNTFLFGIGPTLGYGLSGKYKYIITSTIPGFPAQTQSGDGHVKFDGKKSSDVPVGDPDQHVKALDIGAGILGGYKLSNGLYFQAGFTLGLNDLDSNPNSSLKNNGASIKLGYMFGKKQTDNLKKNRHY